MQITNIMVIFIPNFCFLSFCFDCKTKPGYVNSNGNREHLAPVPEFNEYVSKSLLRSII